MNYWDAGHPYRWRTWIRSHLPWLLIDAGVMGKAVNCESARGVHWWYKIDESSRGCYHCQVVEEALGAGYDTSGKGSPTNANQGAA